jgi:hypothetical protein
MTLIIVHSYRAEHEALNLLLLCGIENRSTALAIRGGG